MEDKLNAKSVYLFADRTLPVTTNETGAKNLLTHHGLRSAHEKYCQKKVRETLNHFLPHLPGIMNMGPTPDDSSLRYTYFYDS